MIDTIQDTKKRWIPTIIVIGLILTFIILLSYFGTETKDNVANSDTVKIGVVSPLTGNIAYLGNATVNGMRLAEDEIKNKYGENSIRLLVEDSKGVPAEGVTIVERMISLENPDIVFSELTGVSMSVSPIALRNEKLLVYSAFTPNVLDSNPMAIKVFLNFDDACQQFVSEYAGEESILIIDETQTNGEICLEGLKESGYDSSKAKIELIDANSDYRTILLRAKQNNFDRLVLLCYENTCLNIIKQAVELDIDIPIFCNKDNCATEKILDSIGLETMPETIFFVQKVSPDYINKYKNKYGENSAEADILYSSTGYDTVTALFDSVKKCQKGDNSCIMEQISKQKSSLNSALNFSFVDRVMVPEISFYEIRDGKLEILE